MKKMILPILIILTFLLIISIIPLISYALITKHLTPILVVLLLLLAGTTYSAFGVIRRN